MSNGNGHHWSKFWWCDWQNDKALQSCSFAARGLWIELLGICHASDRTGYLLVNGEPPAPDDLADMLGKTTAREVGKLLDELERRRIFSRTTEGIIYSRRMVRDAVASEAGREHIEKRWNGAKPTHPPNSPPITPPNRGPTREPISEPNSRAYRPPTSPPITQKLEPEVQTEPDEEKKESNLKNLTSTSPVLARVAAACETPPEGTYGAEPDEPPTSNAIQLATKNLVGKVARKLESSGKTPLGKRPQLTVIEQQNHVLYGEVMEPGPPRGPVDPQRTVAEQYAHVLGISLAEATARLTPTIEAVAS